MAVRRLDPVLVDRIAAGEVVERPASAVKELVENALDAGATRIEIVLEGGGRRLIRVVDDGAGMSPDDLDLAVERHATSKLPDGDLFTIATLGFRGEALPSIASVARLTIATRQQGAPHGSSILVDAGLKHPVRPAGLDRGTRVEVADLFFATPARLKFLRTDRAEAQAVADVVKPPRHGQPRRTVRARRRWRARAGLCRSAGGGRTGSGGAARAGARPGFRTEQPPARCRARGGVRRGLRGIADLPLATAGSVYLFVNGRPVRDKLLLGAVKAAYADVVPHGRHPAAGAVHLLPRLCGGRERTSRQERGALPRTGARARAWSSARSSRRWRMPGISPRTRLLHARSMRFARRSRLSAWRSYAAPRPVNWDWRASPERAGRCPGPSRWVRRACAGRVQRPG